MKTQAKNALRDDSAGELAGVPLEDLLFDDYPFEPLARVSAGFLPSPADGRPASPLGSPYPSISGGEAVPGPVPGPLSSSDGYVFDNLFWRHLKDVGAVFVGIVSLLATALALALMILIVTRL